MTFRSAICRCLCTLGLLAFAFPAIAPGQTPAREQLLNGLSVMSWQRPGDANVFLKLRLNSGAAFDLAGKAGTMALLADALFPDPATREYVTGELGGRLEVSTNYDAIEVTISGKASALERMIEILRNAILTLNLSAENVAKLREARRDQVSKGSASPALIADRAVAARLFGTFPYGHPTEGDSESLAKVERADLMLAQERFLHSDNADLVVIGGFEPPRLMRALRQLLGPWQKGDRLVAATFRQPNAPDDRLLLVNMAGISNAEIRLAVRGLSRSDRDAVAASLLARIVRERWQAAVPELASVSVRHEAHALPGMFVFAASVSEGSAVKALAAADDVMKSLTQTGPNAPELDRARAAMQSEVSSRPQLDSLADAWLDSETYKISSTIDAAKELTRISVADIQRVAARLFKDAARVEVVVADAAQLNSGLGGKIEIRNYQPDVTPASVPPKSPAKSPTRP